MGTLRGSVQRAKVQKLGRYASERSANLINKVWSQIEKAVESWELDFQRVRIYQDGLPVCGREIDIVTELAKAGSRNHKLLFRLKEKGATIVGTESSELLVEEYELSRQILAARNALEAARVEARQGALSCSLLKRRDQYIAERINSTLRAGEIGIVFLGMYHALENLLSKDILVTYPIHRPLDYGGEIHGKKRQYNSDRG